MANTQVSLVGNLTADPELRFTQGNIPLARFSVAVSDGTKDNPSTSFYDCTAWRDLAENLATCLSKGQRVIVVGVLKQSTWESDNGKRSKVEVVADSVGPDLRWATAEVKKTEKNHAARADELPEPGARKLLVEEVKNKLRATEEAF